MSSSFERAMLAIDAAHADDPERVVEDDEGGNGAEVAGELLYARRCSRHLEAVAPQASEALRLAVRAQHLRRWETPRGDFPATRAGYLAWRLGAKRRAADVARALCLESGLSQEVSDRVGALVRKEDLRHDAEAQALEDVACLVFLEQHFATFLRDHDEAKVVAIIRKTWAKMGDAGRRLALELPLEGRAAELVAKALAE